MKETLLEVLAALDRAIEEMNRENAADGLVRLPKATIRILGQVSLLVHPDPRLEELSLFATADVDAILDADYVVSVEFRRLLGEDGLELDPDSEKVWLPTGSTFTELMATPRLCVEVLDPVFALTSKAIKAPEKNRLLVRDALPAFGPELRDLIEAHGGNCADFE